MPKSKGFGKGWIKDVSYEIHSLISIHRIIDFGVGRGTYWNLLHDVFSDTQWIGIEAWEPYVEQYALRDKYDKLIIQDMLELDLDSLPEFEIGILGDVLEHVQKDKAVTFVKQLLQKAKLLIISLPLGYRPQDAFEGNPYEIHLKDDWFHEEVVVSFPGIRWAYIEGTNGVYLLSYYSHIGTLLKDVEKSRFYERHEGCFIKINPDRIKHLLAYLLSFPVKHPKWGGNALRHRIAAHLKRIPPKEK